MFNEVSKCTATLVSEPFGSDLDVVNAARVSFNSESSEFTPDDAKLIDYLIRNKHVSPFEMCYIKFKIDAPIFVARQFMRHRTFSFNEISLRYVDAPKSYFVPDLLRARPSNRKQGSGEDLDEGKNDIALNSFKESVQKTISSYEFMQSLDVANELARGVLPVAQMTSFICAVNLRNLLHFLELRMDNHAQQEIRELAHQMYHLVQPYFPVTFESWNTRILNARTFDGEELKMISKAVNSYIFDGVDPRTLRILKEKLNGER